MNSIENIYTVPVFIENNVIRPTFSGTPNPSLQCSVICESVNLTKSPLGQMKLAELYKQPNHAIFSQIRYGLYSVPVQTKTQRIVLTSITGSISVLMFVVRSTGQAGDSDYLTPWHFAPIKSYEILDQSSSNIIGGQPISSVVQRSLLRKWTKGTYIEEVYGNSTYRGNENNYANVYMWCFSQNPLDSVIKGRPMGNHKFSGNESLVINFDDQTLESPWVIDVFGYSESVLETGANSLNVISL
jgi:hypothetical protein